MKEISGKKIAILATNGFEESELFEPMKALEKSGAEIDIISPEQGKIKAWDKTDWGKSIKVDKTVGEARVDDYDALVLPGGVINPDHLRRDQKAVDFVRQFFNKGKLVAAVCHGPQMLIEADVVRGRTLTSFSSVKKDLVNAGAIWIDKEVVVDGHLITSRNPGDLKAFSEKISEELARVPQMVH
jgi:protease I